MTNGEKYLKDGVDVGKFWNDFIDYIDEHSLGFNANNFETFLNDTVKPTLTEDEQVILRNIDKNYTEICRNESGYLCLLEVRETGTKFDDTFACYNHLFQFIKPRRRI